MYIFLVYFSYYKYIILVMGDFYMSIAYHKNSNRFVQYTVRMNENVLEEIKKIAKKENISINSCINQSLQFAIDDYKKNNKK